MDTDGLYIEQKRKEDFLYSVLQKKTLDEIQRLSGSVWTDFNAHDPGVTIADVANYALTELDYKLGFDLQDYLTGEAEAFSPEHFGLFFPEDVYSNAPVTPDDYRKLLYAEFPALEWIGIQCDAATGAYNINVRCSPLDESPDILEKVQAHFQAHRNLCETLKNVRLQKTLPLFFHAELEIEAGADPAEQLALVYWHIIRYLSGSVLVERAGECIPGGLSPEEWLEGPTGKTRVTIPRQHNTEDELYKQLVCIPGIRMINACYFLDQKGRIITNFSPGYQIAIPRQQQDFRVRMTVGELEVSFDADQFMENLQVLHQSDVLARLCPAAAEGGEKGADACRFLPGGVYRRVFGHKPIAADMPGCYGLRNGAVPSSATDAGKGCSAQLSSYLDLYDRVIRRGLSELRLVKDMLSLENGNAAVLSTMDILPPQGQIQYKTNDRFRDVFGVKTRYLDFLDRLFGVESCPDWLSEFSADGETEDELLKRRMAFLRQVPHLVRNRFRACDIEGGLSASNISGIKAYLSWLLGMNADETVSVGNILPSHNLILMGDDPEYKPFRDRMTSMLIDESRMDRANIGNIEKIGYSPVEENEWRQCGRKERTRRYEALRRELGFFHTNMISGGLFRGGVSLDNYKLVHLGEGEYLLAFWNNEDREWCCLGRMNDRERLLELARTLRHYLRELNLKSEVVYVVERQLLNPPEYFTVSFVFPDWTARFKSARFRERCKQLVRSLLPAHLNARLHWLDVLQMQRFEENYRKWCVSLHRSGSETYADGILHILNHSKSVSDV